ncbi:MAG: bifunctional 5,10-methylenetetrahydrofolate dehydrogenase/5,10-methenyltetrahydrofolate cyclohydrolase [Dorea sp.]|nr:bifunctional 5,10-methylenetetrahydrofolate dehydrogenase/5,10-methenyltetrahydrofolate cyclohydrolase [Dorea sp.]
MSLLLKGADVAKAMKAEIIEKVDALKERGIEPCLTIIRVGAREDDLAYERGAKKRMELTGIQCRVVELPLEIDQKSFEREFQKVNDDPSVHGILLFRPLPKHLNEEAVKNMIHPFKDVDCMCPQNFAKVFCGDETGFAPCTPEAVMEMLRYYEIDLTGKKVTLVGRSMVVGKPLSMLLMKKNATVTICHTRTKDLAAECRNAEIIVAAAGKAKMIGADMVNPDSIVVDVGINVDAEGNLCGDVDFDAVADQVSAISPVPRGVGSITTSVLAMHVVRAAQYLNS